MNYWGIFFFFILMPAVTSVGLYLCYLAEQKEVREDA